MILIENDYQLSNLLFGNFLSEKGCERKNTTSVIFKNNCGTCIIMLISY